MCAAAQQVGRIHCAAFTDDVLFAEMANKATFWQQRAYFGVDLTKLFEPALDSYFAQAKQTLSGSFLNLAFPAQ
jgi:histone-arginine methyltransferase CARM1